MWAPPSKSGLSDDESGDDGDDGPIVINIVREYVSREELVAAAQQFREAAMRGDPQGAYDLGVSYLNGEGVERDDAEGVRWLRQAAASNVALAQAGLGNCYANGSGVAQRDWSEAFRWWQLAANQGVSVAQTGLGNCYANGFGVQQDFVQAAMWWSKAGEREVSAEEARLGKAVVNGGIPCAVDPFFAFARG